mmetsp:Transcript_20634/g.56996  ORF Transcript_20634/g.56996 Transcript_20634/m.56996 type:complete len:84 (+) Transcript_20634:371-622(+)
MARLETRAQQIAPYGKRLADWEKIHRKDLLFHWEPTTIQRKNNPARWLIWSISPTVSDIIDVDKYIIDALLVRVVKADPEVWG